MSDPSERIVLVTGATGAIGEAIARGLLQRDMTVVITARDARRGAAAVTRIRQSTGRDTVRCEIVDLASAGSIAALRERWTGPLHVLVNAAAETPRRRQQTEEGIERQFATNVLGYHRMIAAFADVLSGSAPARVINVASYWAGGLDLEDLELRRRAYDNDLAYRQAKQADRMLSVGWAERLRDAGVTVNACHPGDVASTLSANLGFGGHQSPDEAAKTPVWLATEPEGGTQTGGYFENCRRATCRFSEDRQGIAELMQRLDGYG